MRNAALLLGIAALAACGGGDGVGTTGTDVGNPIAVDLQVAAYHLALDGAAVDAAKAR